MLASRLRCPYWKSSPTKPVAQAARRTGEARLATEGAVFRRCWLGSVVDWPLAISTTEQQGATTRSERRNGCSCALSPPSGAPRPHCLLQVCAVDGRPGERRGGKRIAVRGAVGSADGAASGAPQWRHQ
jgi:hypothetical protein